MSTVAREKSHSSRDATVIAPGPQVGLRNAPLAGQAAVPELAREAKTIGLLSELLDIRLPLFHGERERYSLDGFIANRHPRHRGQLSNGLSEVDAPGLHHEPEDVAVLARREIVPELLLVVHENDGVRSLLKGDNPFISRPALTRRTRRPTTAETGMRLRKSSRKFGENISRCPGDGATGLCVCGAGSRKLEPTSDFPRPVPLARVDLFLSCRLRMFSIASLFAQPGAHRGPNDR
jgi:hypothetical protein